MATDWEKKIHYEPAPHNREFFRRNRDGQRGYLVRRDGKTFIRLDRANEELLEPYREGTWEREVDVRPITKFQVARITFEADKAICLALGLHDLGRREWLNLTDEKRAKWMHEGPGDDPKRRRLYDAITIGLEGMSE